MQCRLLLIRHGESALGSQGRYAGHFDTPLTPNGKRQVARLCPRFERHHVHEIYSSDLSRCRDTAEILAGGREIFVTRKLRELDFGAWEGCTHDELIRSAPSRYGRWLAAPHSIHPPRGESLPHLIKRVHSFVRELVRRHQGKTLALVTHGGPIRVLLASDPAEFWSVQVPPASMKLMERFSLREVAS